MRRVERLVRAGKIAPAFFDRSVRPHLGRPRSDVLVGPRTGIDVGVVRIAPRRVLLVKTDPIYIEPRLGWDRAAWFAFHIVANDFTTTGRRPEWGAIDLDVPPETSDRTLATILRVIGREAGRLGAQLVTGHTGRYEGCSFPTVGSGTLLGAAPAGGYVTTADIPAGAVLLLSRTPGLEATAMLATFYPEVLRDALGGSDLRRALGLIPQMSSVSSALRAAEVGLGRRGIHAMHDASEGGVRRAAWEMAVAAGLGLNLDLSAACIDPVVLRVSRLFRFDPFDASSEGTLLLAAEPDRVDDVTLALRSGGAVVSKLGEFTRRGAPRRDGRRPLRPAPADSYWAVVQRRGLKRPVA